MGNWVKNTKSWHLFSVKDMLGGRPGRLDKFKVVFTVIRALIVSGYGHL